MFDLPTLFNSIESRIIYLNSTVPFLKFCCYLIVQLQTGREHAISEEIYLPALEDGRPQHFQILIWPDINVVAGYRIYFFRMDRIFVFRFKEGFISGNYRTSVMIEVIKQMMRVYTHHLLRLDYFGPGAYSP